MHGIIHVLFKDFIIVNFGDAVWQQIMTKCGVEDDATVLDTKKQYDDSVTLAAIGAGVELSGIPLDTALELFGEFFAVKVIGMGWSKMLKSMGKNMMELVSNLNEMHHALERDLRTAVFPVCEVTAQDAEGTSFLLVYTSSRFFPTLVVGACRGVAAALFGCKLEFRELERSQSTCSWNVKEAGRIENPPAENSTSKSTTFSFTEIHEALASLFLCCTDKVVLHDGAPPPYGQACRSSIAGADNPQATLRMVYSIPEGVTLTDWLKTLKDDARLDLAKRLYRGIPAKRVCSGWQDLDQLAVASKNFWEASARSPEYFRWSSEVLNFEAGGEKESNRHCFPQHAFQEGPDPREQIARQRRFVRVA